MARRTALLAATLLLAGCGEPYFALEGVDSYPPPPYVSTQVAAGAGGYAAAAPSIVLQVGEEKWQPSLVSVGGGGPPAAAFAWVSSNEQVVRIESQNIRGMAAGTAFLTGTLLNDRSVTITIEATVVANHTVKLIRLDPAVLRLPPGGAQLVAAGPPTGSSANGAAIAFDSYGVLPGGGS